jgi:hypothetical protein
MIMQTPLSKKRNVSLNKEPQIYWEVIEGIHH